MTTAIKWADLTYVEGYDLAQKEFAEGIARRIKRPRRADGAPGRFGYSDGYTDAWNRVLSSGDAHAVLPVEGVEG